MRWMLPFVLLFTACPDDGDPPDPPPEPIVPEPGKHVHTLTLGDEQREVIVYVPAAAATRAPVVMAFHGSGGTGAGFSTSSGWMKKADEVGLIAVFPTALVHCYHDERGEPDDDLPEEAGRRIGTKWANGELGHVGELPLCSESELAQLSAANRALADHPLADDLAFTDAIVDLLIAEYGADPARIYLAGFSNGASFVSRLGAEVPERFAGVAAAAGSLKLDLVAPRALPTMLTVGELDDRFTKHLGVTSLPVDESVVELWKDDCIAVFLHALGLTADYTFDLRTVNGMKVARFRYGARFRAQVIEGLHHQYANGTNHPVVYADLFWSFFTSH